jgi:hypothetical protein
MARDAQATLHAALRILSTIAEQHPASRQDESDVREYAQDLDTPVADLAAGLVHGLLTDLSLSRPLSDRRRLV